MLLLNYFVLDASDWLARGAVRRILGSRGQLAPCGTGHLALSMLARVIFILIDKLGSAGLVLHEASWPLAEHSHLL